MLFEKKKYEVQLSHGAGRIVTTEMRGVIDHLIVIPSDRRTIWDLKIIDTQEDIVFEVENHGGRLDYKDGIVVGKDQSEVLVLEFDNASANTFMEVIFIIKER